MTSHASHCSLQEKFVSYNSEQNSMELELERALSSDKMIQPNQNEVPTDVISLDVSETASKQTNDVMSRDGRSDCPPIFMDTDSAVKKRNKSGDGKQGYLDYKQEGILAESENTDSTNSNFLHGSLLGSSTVETTYAKRNKMISQTEKHNSSGPFGIGRCSQEDVSNSFFQVGENSGYSPSLEVAGMVTRTIDESNLVPQTENEDLPGVTDVGNLELDGLIPESHSDFHEAKNSNLTQSRRRGRRGGRRRGKNKPSKTNSAEGPSLQDVTGCASSSMIAEIDSVVQPTIEASFINNMTLGDIADSAKCDTHPQNSSVIEIAPNNSLKTSEECGISAEVCANMASSGHKAEVSLPPSPIKGVVEDVRSSDCMNQNNQLGVFNEDGVSFLFPVGDGIPKDDLNAEGHLNVHEYENARHTTSRNSYPSSSCTEKHQYRDIELASFSINLNIESDMSSVVAVDEDTKLEAAPVLPKRPLISSGRKKLLVLDINGVLVDIIQDYRCSYKADIRISGRPVFKRPFCDEFLQFCFQNFEIGIWSSRRRYNVDKAVDFLMGDLKHNLLFCWSQSKCTDTGFQTFDNMHKPLVLKELKKLWDKDEPDLPWEKGEYSPSNTLLVDDSPYKSTCNPPYTAIFPYPYHFEDHEDNSLGPNGDLRLFLEGLAMSDDVQNYVREHPFGQPAINDAHPSWQFYLEVKDKIESSSAPS